MIKVVHDLVAELTNEGATFEMVYMVYDTDYHIFYASFQTEAEAMQVAEKLEKRTGNAFAVIPTPNIRQAVKADVVETITIESAIAAMRMN